VVAKKDRFSRFGFELFEWIFKQFGASIVVVDGTEQFSPEVELAEDLMSIITVFSARYYGSRKYKILPENSDLS
jgi:predicted site-specific integrase-resolvase